MAKAIFIQNPSSIYKDVPGIRYHFPKRYLGTVQGTIGDWVIFYEGKTGALGYVSVQKVARVVPDPDLPDHFFAELDLGSRWDFEHIVPRSDSSGQAFEAMLRGPDGAPTTGGANVSAVRKLPERDFAAILNHGLRPLDGPGAIPREDPAPHELADGQAPFDHAPLSGVRPQVLTSRALRDASFARMVKAAYGARCAISGLNLSNGGGRPEVQAAHIRAVAHAGPDTVNNGLALSGTLHWMFDRGLISVAADTSILISHNKVPAETAQRLIAPDQKLILPKNPRHHPHPEFLRYHREEIFGSA